MVELKICNRAKESRRPSRGSGIVFGLLCACLWFAPRSSGGPLDVWTSISSGTTNHLRSIGFGSGRFVVTGDSGLILSSSNGTAWVPVMSGVTNSLLGVAHGQERFVAVGKSGAIVTSIDGSTWAPQNSGISDNLNAVVWSAFGWVAVGENGQILTSADGSNWVSQTSGTGARLKGVGNGFGNTYTGAGANAPALFWSTNGASWSYLTNAPLNSQPDLFNGGFAFGNGILIGVLSRGAFASTTDGLNWTNRYSPFFYCFGLAYARNTFVTVGGNFGDGSGGRTIGSSINGIAWQTNYSKSAESRLVSVAYGKHRFVAVGDKGSILVSAPLLWLS